MEKKSLTERARAWLREDPDPETKDQLASLIQKNDEDLLKSCFNGSLQFGTAGLRGILGPGPNRMNKAVIRQTTFGLASYIKKNIERACDRGVVVGYDARNRSKDFAEECAGVLTAAGINVYLYPGYVPTPLVSFAARKIGSAAALMITASHNPPEYNGYKVFWETGGQIVPPHDEGIARERDEAPAPSQIPVMDLQSARKARRLFFLGDDIIESYLDGVSSLRVRPEAPYESDLVIAYTPLHGVGAELTQKVFSRAGFKEVHVVESQREPDPAFPTVAFPNPEEDGSLDALIELAKKLGADVALAADPDADRLGVALPSKTGGSDWSLLGGDEIGILLAHYLLTQGGGGSERLVATSVVSSRMLSAMASHHGIHYIDTLTGLKWIVDAALRHQAQNGSRLVLGYENALGYMVGELVRDKDGISAAALFAEMCAWLKKNGRTPWDLLKDAYRVYGVFMTRTKSIVFEPHQGDRIKRIMGMSRRSKATTIGDFEIISKIDVQDGALGLPPENLLIFELDKGARVLLRPSGTEPKLKSYYEVQEKVSPGESVSKAKQRAMDILDQLVDAHQAILQG